MPSTRGLYWQMASLVEKIYHMVFLHHFYHAASFCSICGLPESAYTLLCRFLPTICRFLPPMHCITVQPPAWTAIHWITCPLVRSCLTIIATYKRHCRWNMTQFQLPVTSFGLTCRSLPPLRYNTIVKTEANCTSTWISIYTTILEWHLSHFLGLQVKYTLYMAESTFMKGDEPIYL